MELMRIQTVVDVVYEEGFRKLSKPLYKVASGAVIKNPYAGSYVEELTELIEAVSYTHLTLPTIYSV